MLLLQRVRNCADDAEYEMLRQRWDTVNRAQYAPRQAQRDVLVSLATDRARAVDEHGAVVMSEASVEIANLMAAFGKALANQKTVG